MLFLLYHSFAFANNSNSSGNVTLTLSILAARHNLLRTQDRGLGIVGQYTDSCLQHTHRSKWVAASTRCWWWKRKIYDPRDLWSITKKQKTLLDDIHSYIYIDSCCSWGSAQYRRFNQKTLLTLQANIKISTFSLKGKCYYMVGGGFPWEYFRRKKKISLLLQKILIVFLITKQWFISATFWAIQLRENYGGIPVRWTCKYLQSRIF